MSTKNGQEPATAPDPTSPDEGAKQDGGGPPKDGRKGGPRKRPRPYLPVTFRCAGREHRVPIDPRRFDLHNGDLVVVETDRGLSIARALSEPMEDEDPHFSRRVRKVVRPAREPDLLAHAEGKAREEGLLRRAKQITRLNNLDLQIVSVDYQGIGNKLTVFFASERRVDFRNLVKDLSQQLGVRIEMRQIGVRDEAKHLGGCAHCGRELCCSTWLRDFAAVSIRMAKDQNLALSPNKISGLCGRLMCCLSYEHLAYADARKGLPKSGKRVLSKHGPGRVLSLDILRRSFLFLGDDGTRRTLGPDDLERDEEGRPVRPPPPGEGLRGDRKPDGGRPPRGKDQGPRKRSSRGGRGRGDRRKPAQDGQPQAAGPGDKDGNRAAGEEGENKRPRGKRRRRGRGRRRGPRKEPKNDG